MLNSHCVWRLGSWPSIAYFASSLQSEFPECGSQKFLSALKKMESGRRREFSTSQLEAGSIFCRLSAFKNIQQISINVLNFSFWGRWEFSSISYLSALDKHLRRDIWAGVLWDIIKSSVFGSHFISLIAPLWWSKAPSCKRAGKRASVTMKGFQTQASELCLLNTYFPPSESWAGLNNCDIGGNIVLPPLCYKRLMHSSTNRPPCSEEIEKKQITLPRRATRVSRDPVTIRLPGWAAKSSYISSSELMCFHAHQWILGFRARG